MITGGDTKKAAKALKAVTKSSFKKTRKPRYSTTFHRPKTLTIKRAPLFPKKRCPPASQPLLLHNRQQLVLPQRDCVQLG